MLLIDAIKPIKLFKGGELKAYKIKQFMFLFALDLLAATKTLFKRNDKILLFRLKIHNNVFVLRIITYYKRKGIRFSNFI